MSRRYERVTFDVTTAVVGGRYVEVGTADRSVAPAGAVSLKVVGVAGHDAAIGDKVTVEISKPIDLIPGAAFHVIPDAGHLPCVEQPAAYAAILAPFVQEHAR